MNRDDRLIWEALLKEDDMPPQPPAVIQQAEIQNPAGVPEEYKIPKEWQPVLSRRLSTEMKIYISYIAQDEGLPLPPDLPASYDGIGAAIEDIYIRLNVVNDTISGPAVENLPKFRKQLIKEQKDINDWIKKVGRYTKSLDAYMNKKYKPQDGDWIRAWLLKKAA